MWGGGEGWGVLLGEALPARFELPQLSSLRNSPVASCLHLCSDAQAGAQGTKFSLSLDLPVQAAGHVRDCLASGTFPGNFTLKCIQGHGTPAPILVYAAVLSCLGYCSTLFPSPSASLPHPQYSSQRCFCHGSWIMLLCSSNHLRSTSHTQQNSQSSTVAREALGHLPPPPSPITCPASFLPILPPALLQSRRPPSCSSNM